VRYPAVTSPWSRRRNKVDHQLKIGINNNLLFPNPFFNLNFTEEL